MLKIIKAPPVVLNNAGELEFITNTLIKEGFHKNPNVKEYQLWKPIKSSDVIYLRVYKSKVKVFILGDFDPYEINMFSFKDFIVAIKENNNLYKTLICNKR